MRIAKAKNIVCGLGALLVVAGTAYNQAGQPVTLGDLAGGAESVKIGEAAQMPDIVGVHLHMPLREANAVLRKQYPTGKFGVSPTSMPTIAQPVAVAVSLNPGGGLNFADQVSFDVTLPPERQIVWRVSRLAQRQHVNRGTLLAALRAKYGKEAVVYPENANDGRIDHMWWLFDEQGRRVPAPASGPLAVRGCGESGNPNPAASNYLLWAVQGLQPPAEGWAATSCVAVDAQFVDGGDREIIETLHIAAVNIPLLMRNSKAAAVWWKAANEKLRQLEVEKSKQAAPKL